MLFNDPIKMLRRQSVQRILLQQLQIHHTTTTSATEVVMWLRISIEAIRTSTHRQLLNLPEIRQKRQIPVYGS